MHYGFGNGLLMTGDQGYVDTWRGVIDNVNANSKISDGQTLYPHMHGDEGWYDYTPEPFNTGALEVYYWSMDRADLPRVQENEWVRFLEGDNPEYPVNALQEDLAEVRERIGKVRSDSTSPDTRMSDDMNGFNPAMVSRLTELMLGGLPTERAGLSSALSRTLLQSDAAEGRPTRRCWCAGRKLECGRDDADAG